MARESKEASERLQRLGAEFDDCRKKLDRGEQSTESRDDAEAFWQSWPSFYFRILELEREFGQESYDTLLRLTWAHESATRWLMREAKKIGCNSASLWEESRVCREMMLSRQLAIGFDAASRRWPDLLGELRCRMPSNTQRAIVDGEAAFYRLVAKLEVEEMEAPGANQDTALLAKQDGALSAASLAKQHGVSPESLRKKLQRWRQNNLDGWMQNLESKQNEPRYLYFEDAVRSVIDGMKTSDEKI
jgi:hypothetical protein